LRQSSFSRKVQETMTLMNNNLPTAQNDVRINRKWSRVRLALASSGIAGTMLLTSLLGAPVAHAQTHAPAVTHVRTVQMAYSQANDYVDLARQAAIAAGINPDLFVRQIQQESGFNPGATAAAMGVNPYDPTSALYGGARLMAQLSAQFGGDYAKALAAYNGGPGAVQNAVAQGGANWLAFMPAESQNYVHIIMG
jgi:soluble lytic murein transglycosylase-like protein